MCIRDSPPALPPPLLPRLAPRVAREVGEREAVADLACYPWFEWMRTVMKEPGKGTTVADFMRTARWKHLNAWADRIKARPAVQRGMTVNGFGGKPPKPWLVEQR